MRTRLSWSFHLLLLITPAGLGAQQAAPPGCTAAEHRQFDFWIGDWEVRGVDGRLLGHNRIGSALDGCAVLEEWTGAAGGTGRSLNAYDRASRSWKQNWVDNRGGRLDLSGGWNAGRMVLTGESRRPDGTAVRHRVSFTPAADGVRQLWEQSTDGGATWTVAFDGTYRKAGSSRPPMETGRPKPGDGPHDLAHVSLTSRPGSASPPPPSSRCSTKPGHSRDAGSGT